MGPKRLAAAALLLLAPAAAADDAWLPKPTADLILLDKVRGQPTAMAVKVGDGAAFGSLSLRVTACLVRPPDQPADAAAFVAVADSRGAADVFRGWILANEPAVSQMEHPVYDLKLVGCH